MGKKKQQNIETTICEFIDEPPLVMYDVGVGPKSEYMVLGEIYPDMKIVGMEPSRNFFLSLLPSFPGLLLPYAVWNEPAELELHRRSSEYDATDAPTVFSVGPGKRELTETETVTAKTLDWIDEQMGCLDRILLWMDIEGAELKALQGATKMLEEHRVKWLNLEVMPSEVPTEGWPLEQEISDFLAGYGYKLAHKYGMRKWYQPSKPHCDAIYVLA